MSKPQTTRSGDGCRADRTWRPTLLGAWLVAATGAAAAGPGYTVGRWGVDEPNVHACALLEDPDGSVWIGTLRGICQMRGHRLQCGRPAVPGGARIVVLEDREGRLWIGTSSGLFEWSAGGPLRPACGGCLDGQPVAALAEARDGGVWAGLGATGGVAWSGRGDRTICQRRGTAAVGRDGVVRGSGGQPLDRRHQRRLRAPAADTRHVPRPAAQRSVLHHSPQAFPCGTYLFTPEHPGGWNGAGCWR